jgi:hypothetical protein
MCIGSNFHSRSKRRAYVTGNKLITTITVTSLLLFGLTAPLIAQNNNSEPLWGTTSSPAGSAVKDAVVIPMVDPAMVGDPAMEPVTDVAYTHSSYATGGTALRNRASSTINISGAIGPIHAAFIYWAVISENAPPVSDGYLTISRETPGTGTATVKGTEIGTGASPCWPGNRITVYRGTVPTSVANGNGVYRVSISPVKGTAGTTDGSDPWKNAVPPLWEGASLVLVGTGAGTVAIYDQGFAGHTFTSNSGISYTLNLPVAASGSLTLFDSIGADGQIGVSRRAVVGLAQETTTINSHAIAGVDSAYNDSDWNGSSGYPLPQLWDDTGHDITAFTPKGTKSLSVQVKNFFVSSTTYDCLTPVANVIYVQ